MCRVRVWDRFLYSVSTSIELYVGLGFGLRDATFELRLGLDLDLET